MGDVCQPCCALGTLLGSCHGDYSVAEFTCKSFYFSMSVIQKEEFDEFFFGLNLSFE